MLHLWLHEEPADETSLYQPDPLQRSHDQALAESIANYSNEVARSRDTFLAILSHDLRSPLTAIANSGSTGESGPARLPARPWRRGRVTRGAARMSAMIRDLLEYTRTRLGRSIPISPEPTSMGQICRIAYDEARAAHPDRIFRLETSGPLEGQFDTDRLLQVISNLLDNAVHHGARTQPITLRRSASGAGHGPGAEPWPRHSGGPAVGDLQSAGADSRRAGGGDSTPATASGSASTLPTRS